jgi:hypothetical protein
MYAATKKMHFEKASALMNRLKHPPVQDILIFFSDKKELLAASESFVSLNGVGRQAVYFS